MLTINCRRSNEAEEKSIQDGELEQSFGVERDVVGYRVVFDKLRCAKTVTSKPQMFSISLPELSPPSSPPLERSG